MESNVGRFLAWVYVQCYDTVESAEQREALAVAVSWGDPGAVAAATRGRRVKVTPAIAEEMHARAAERNAFVFGALGDYFSQPVGEVPAS